MAKKNIQNAQAIENNAIATVNEKEEVTMAEVTKTVEIAEATAIEEAGPKTMLLFTASRGKNTKLRSTKSTPTRLSTTSQTQSKSNGRGRGRKVPPHMKIRNSAQHPV